VNRPPVTSSVAHGERPVAITFFTPARFAADPQVGLPIVQEWHSLLRWLTWPSFAETKPAHGAWCPTELKGGAVKGGRGPVSLLVADVDDCGPGAIDHSVFELSAYAGAVIPTFRATPENPKHRIVLLPDRALTPDEFPLAWAKMASTLERSGIRVDRGCKNINRLYFACITPSPAAWLGARLLSGGPVPVDAMMARARAEHDAEEAARKARPPPRPVLEEHRDHYVAGAVAKARDNILGAAEGGRHEMLLKEAFSLARFGLSEFEIADALLEPFVTVAGEPRRREGERAIHDAVLARGTT
jgi:hypothetical protein